jgi:hypothetical protein
VGSAAETTVASGGSVRVAAASAVGGRLLLDPGLLSRERSETKLNELERPRKDCDCDDDDVVVAVAVAAEVDEGGARKDWPGSRKEWLLREVVRSKSEF